MLPVHPYAFSLRQLQYIVAVADSLSLNRADDECDVSQPSLSLQVAELERVLAIKIFERDPHRVALIAVGRDFVESTRAVLRAADALVDTARRRNIASANRHWSSAFEPRRKAKLRGEREDTFRMASFLNSELCGLGVFARDIPRFGCGFPGLGWAAWRRSRSAEHTTTRAFPCLSAAAAHSTSSTPAIHDNNRARSAWRCRAESVRRSLPAG
jgi:hypothetical protein